MAQKSQRRLAHRATARHCFLRRELVPQALLAQQRPPRDRDLGPKVVQLVIFRLKLFLQQ